MSPARFRLALSLGLATGASALGFAAAPVPASPPGAIRTVDPRRLSGGLFSALDSGGAFGTRPQSLAPRLATPDLSKGHAPLILDSRVGANVRIGDDPAALPATQRGQAEPHIYRRATNPHVLLATFQEGRFSDGGSLDCGYGVSTDGGLSWTRALIPYLTQTSGGSFNRATDPVAAIGLNGTMYLNTLYSASGNFDIAGVEVSRSTDNGATWSSPVSVYQSATTQVMPDKNWMAIDDYANNANTGRLVVTWTNFTTASNGTSNGSNILASISNDGGVTWTTPIAVTPQGSSNQGSQPAFLPDGTLVLAYVTFTDPNSTNNFAIHCKHSTDGGLTYPAAESTIVPQVTAWNDPDLREGSFLPSLAIARQTGELFVTYVGLVVGTPRVFVTKSSDQGATWSTPVVASDNPTGDSVMNAAVAVTPDGQTVSVVFMDKRNAPDDRNFIDYYAALSNDGGTTWQPNVRLTNMSSDIRYAPLTTEGYMLGDYLGVVPPVAGTEPAVAISCDTRTGDSDPISMRFVPAAAPGDYYSWALAWGVPTASVNYTADADGDGISDYLEYLNATDPRQVESGDGLVVHRIDSTTLEVDWAERTDAQPLAAAEGVSAASMQSYVSAGFGQAGVTTSTLSVSDLPTVALAPGLVWRGVRVTVPSGAAEAVARSVRATTSSPVVAARLEGTNATDARLVNVSTRGTIAAGSNNMIVGFVIDGAKSMLIRAAGPSLTAFGITTPLPTPQLALTTLTGSPVTAASATTTLQTATTAVRLGAFPFPPANADVAVLQPLSAGSYTAVVSDANGAAGTALVEAYDADPAPGSPAGPRVANLSTRGSVGLSSPLIAGFVINGTQPRRVLIRAIGPTLAAFNVANSLADPLLQLLAAGGTTPIATNDDWELSRSPAAVAATSQRLGAFALSANSLDAALLVTLAPGGYTAQVTGVNGAAGTALVEVYDAD